MCIPAFPGVSLLHPCFSWNVFRTALNVHFWKSKKTLEREGFSYVNYVLLMF